MVENDEVAFVYLIDRFFVVVSGHHKALTALIDGVRQEVSIGSRGRCSDLLLAFAAMIERQVCSLVM